MKPFEQFYSQQLNSPLTHELLMQQERETNKARALRECMQLQVFGGPKSYPWTDCDPEPWSKK